MKKIKSSLVLFTCLLVVSCTTLVQQGSYTSPDLSEKDPNVKKLVITASTELDQKKKGSQIKLE